MSEKQSVEVHRKSEVVSNSSMEEYKDKPKGEVKDLPFGIELYDNELYYDDNMTTIVEKVINKKNYDLYKKYSSYVLYLSNEVENSDKGDEVDQNINTRVFFKIKLSEFNMFILYSVVPRRTIEKILTLCENKYRKSKTSIGYMTDRQENYKLTDSLNRTSKSVFLYTIRNTSNIEEGKIDHDNAIVYTTDEGIIELENTICNLAQIPLCYLEPLAVVKYEKGNYFNVHHDGSFRRATLLLYLNDVHLSGETIFPHLNLAIQPIQGSAVFWHNNIPVDDPYAITYCMDKILKVRDQKRQLKKKQTIEAQMNQNEEEKEPGRTSSEDILNNQSNGNCQKTNGTKNEKYNKNKNSPNGTNKNEETEEDTDDIPWLMKTSDVINFINDKNNLEKYAIDIIEDELGNKYIADMSMIHQANAVNENKYVINCFFNVNRVRNV